jgi:hypothetical protein
MPAGAPSTAFLAGSFLFPDRVPVAALREPANDMVEAEKTWPFDSALITLGSTSRSGQDRPEKDPGEGDEARGDHERGGGFDIHPVELSGDGFHAFPRSVDKRDSDTMFDRAEVRWNAR